MARQIFKYQIGVTGIQSVPMPEGAKILAVQTQYGVPVIWAMVDPDKPTTDVVIVTVGTGHIVPVEGPLHHIGTYQMDEGRFVGHVFVK